MARLLQKQGGKKREEIKKLFEPQCAQCPAESYELDPRWSYDTEWRSHWGGSCPVWGQALSASCPLQFWSGLAQDPLCTESTLLMMTRYKFGTGSTNISHQDKLEIQIHAAYNRWATWKFMHIHIVQINICHKDDKDVMQVYSAHNSPNILECPTLYQSPKCVHTHDIQQHSNHHKRDH